MMTVECWVTEVSQSHFTASRDPVQFQFQNQTNHIWMWT